MPRWALALLQIIWRVPQGRKGSTPILDEIMHSVSKNMFSCLQCPAQPLKRVRRQCSWEHSGAQKQNHHAFQQKISAQDLPINRVENFIIFFICKIQSETPKKHYRIHTTYIYFDHKNIISVEQKCLTENMEKACFKQSKIDTNQMNHFTWNSSIHKIENRALSGRVADQVLWDPSARHLKIVLFTWMAQLLLPADRQLRFPTDSQEGQSCKQWVTPMHPQPPCQRGSTKSRKGLGSVVSPAQW